MPPPPLCNEYKQTRTHTALSFHLKQNWFVANFDLCIIESFVVGLVNFNEFGMCLAYGYTGET